MSRILVVDDDPSVRHLLADLLSFEGHDVEAAADGPEALAQIDRQRPDCVLLDLMMPGMDGHEVLAHLRQTVNGQCLPVVMLTANTQEQQAWRAWTGGVDYFLGKPFDPDEVVRCVNHLAQGSPERAAAETTGVDDVSVPAIREAGEWSPSLVP